LTDPIEQDELVVHRKGFTKIVGTRYEAQSGMRIRVERQKRMHKFQTGYEDSGPAVPIFTGTEEDARHVYEVLREWFEDD
jgi:K+/H+ antiporter YhaU regulatory subunit KhtT